MKDRAKAAAGRARTEPTRREGDGRAIKQKRGNTLGLKAFEKISAVEGIRLSGAMREDLQSLEARGMDEDQRSRFIAGKYGKT